MFHLRSHLAHPPPKLGPFPFRVSEALRHLAESGGRSWPARASQRAMPGVIHANKYLGDYIKWARTGDLAEMEKLLAEKKLKVDECTPSNVTALRVACEFNQTEVAKMLLANNADPNIDSHVSHRPLRQAAEHGNVELVQALLDGGADPFVLEGGRKAKTMAKDKATAAVIKKKEDELKLSKAA
jgi:ankyrin repeat protein